MSAFKNLDQQLQNKIMAEKENVVLELESTYME
jgi:hypothetical protein